MVSLRFICFLGNLCNFSKSQHLKNVLTRAEPENLPSSFEGLVIELSFNLKIWLLICSYNPYRNSVKEHMRVLSCCLDQNIQKYDNIILMGDHNAEITNASMQEFCESYFLEIMVKKPTCFKNPAKPTCIDLIITN